MVDRIPLGDIKEINLRERYRKLFIHQCVKLLKYFVILEQSDITKISVYRKVTHFDTVDSMFYRGRSKLRSSTFSTLY